MTQTSAPTFPGTPQPALRPAAALPWWSLLLVALLAIGVYANSLANDFAFDDLAIAQGSHITEHQWTAIWTDNYWPKDDGLQPDTLYRPLTLWSYLANEAIGPGVAWQFHLTNVLLHALVCVLVVLLTWRLMGSRPVALLTGALFAIHPIHVEVVANVVGRAEILAALWSLLALLIYLPPAPLLQETAPYRRAWWHGILVAICFFAAILSKETPVTLLVALPLLDLWRWTRFYRPGRPPWWRWIARQSLRYYLPMSALFAVYLGLRKNACGTIAGDARVTHHVVNALVDATIPERIVTPFMLLAKYMLLTLWPQHLSADYSLPSLLPTSNLLYGNAFQPPAILGLLICVLALGAAVMLWRKAPQFVLLIGMFVCGYALVANFIRIGTIFGERLFYWPSIFVLILVSWGLVNLQRHIAANVAPGGRPAFRAFALSLIALAAVALSWRSVVRNTDWADNTTLAISTAQDNLDSGKACAWAGSILMMNDNPAYAEFGKSLTLRAIELTPDYVSARWDIARYYGLRHDLGNSAITVAQAARIDPGTHMTRSAIPALIMEMHANPPATYMPVIEQYQQSHPDDPAAALAMAFGYHAQEKYDQAAAWARKAIDCVKLTRHDGWDQFHEAGAELAGIWFDQGKINDAIDKCRIYASYMRNSVEAHCLLASMLIALGPKITPDDLQEATVHLKIAALIDPANDRARTLSGRLNALLRDHAGRAIAAEGTSEKPGGVGP